VEIIHGLWNTPAEQTYSFAGKLWTVEDSPALPKPTQAGGPPLIIGGHGKRRTPRLAAKFAAEFNVAFPPVDEFTSQVAAVSAACEAEGRDPATMTFSAALILCCGADNEEIARRAAAVHRDPTELRINGAAGSPDEVADTIRRWQAAGATRLYLQVLDLADLDHLDIVANEVAPLLV
jgi:alkanesulfonate monooxygenase SsuD/methylene tetrahydromethanopterin reductase-like flavin-dependent oxidoreductase (luciferase family)